MSYVTGKTIRELREKRNITQKELADIIHVSNKTISKWETEKGLPDIGIIEDLSKALGVSLVELLTGDLKMNDNQSGNMKKMLFYTCPMCGNIITSVGRGAYSCCGITLSDHEPETCDEDHAIMVEVIDNEYSVTMKHPMSKNHYISFIAYVVSDTVELTKLYPEQEISVRFRKHGHGFIYAYCNRHSLFRVTI